MCFPLCPFSFMQYHLSLPLVVLLHCSPLNQIFCKINRSKSFFISNFMLYNIVYLLTIV